MSYDQVLEVFNKITYKPGWKFTLLPMPYGFVFILRVSTTDSRDASQPIDVVASRQYGPGEISSVELIIKAAGEMIKEIEEHEFREWFKFDGNCVTEPHPDDFGGYYSPEEIDL